MTTEEIASNLIQAAHLSGNLHLIPNDYIIEASKALAVLLEAELGKAKEMHKHCQPMLQQQADIIRNLEDQVRELRAELEKKDEEMIELRNSVEQARNDYKRKLHAYQDETVAEFKAETEKKDEEIAKCRLVKSNLEKGHIIQNQTVDTLLDENQQLRQRLAELEGEIHEWRRKAYSHAGLILEAERTINSLCQRLAELEWIDTYKADLINGQHYLIQNAAGVVNIGVWLAERKGFVCRDTNRPLIHITYVMPLPTLPKAEGKTQVPLLKDLPAARCRCINWKSGYCCLKKADEPGRSLSLLLGKRLHKTEKQNWKGGTRDERF